MKAPLTHRFWWTYSLWNVAQRSMNWEPPQLILNHYRVLWLSPCVAFWSAFCQISWRLLTCHSPVLANSMLTILLHVAEKTKAENIVRPRESWSKTSLFLSSAGLMLECVHHSQRGQDWIALIQYLETKTIGVECCVVGATATLVFLTYFFPLQYGDNTTCKCLSVTAIIYTLEVWMERTQ